MIEVVVVFLIVSVAITAIGFIFKGFLWLGILGITLFLILAITGFVMRRHQHRTV